jgi:hypothetical protein
MKTLAKVGIGCAGVVAVASVGLALVAPTLVREASQVIGPIQKMKRTQTALDDMVDEVGWKRPEPDALSSEQLDRFFAVRQRVEAARLYVGPSLDNLPRKNVHSLEELREVPGIIRSVSDVVGAEMDALVAARMPPAEYHWIERLVYERWRGSLRKTLSYPVAVRAAAAEIASAAAREPDARVRARLERLGAEMKARVPAPPEGVGPPIHELLLSRIEDVERYSLDDVIAPTIPVPR